MRTLKKGDVAEASKCTKNQETTKTRKMGEYTLETEDLLQPPSLNSWLIANGNLFSRTDVVQGVKRLLLEVHVPCLLSVWSAIMVDTAQLRKDSQPVILFPILAELKRDDICQDDTSEYGIDPLIPAFVEEGGIIISKGKERVALGFVEKNCKLAGEIVFAVAGRRLLQKGVIRYKKGRFRQDTCACWNVDCGFHTTSHVMATSVSNLIHSHGERRQKATGNERQ